VIAVTGASGFVGGTTARLLAARGVPLRLVVRDASRAPELGADVRVASRYGAGAEMRAALEGADTVFLVPAEESADRLDQHKTAVDAAVAAGVQRIVYLSFVNASPDATFTLVRHHWATEEHIRASGLRFTFARMNLYLDFLPHMITPDGEIVGPADDGRAAIVARVDVAEVVAALLVSDDHDGATYDVTGREALTFAEIADVLSRETGRAVTFRNETVEEAWASRAVYGAPDWQVEAWVTTYRAVAAGEVAGISDTVARFTGREPLTLAEFLRAEQARGG
jgi:NAD(P)H dehydrogenase (quinone)